MTEINFNENGLVPAIAQDYETGEVRMLAYMNAEAVNKTLESGYVHYYSRSRQELWKKGETSGNLQKFRGLRRDCDADALLILIEQEGVACHTGERNCFYEEYDPDTESWNKVDPLPSDSIGAILGELQRIIRSRAENLPEGSYTTRLLDDASDKSSLDRILEKIGEENTELMLAAKNRAARRFAEESGDLLYHLLVLCRRLDVELSELAGVLQERRR